MDSWMQVGVVCLLKIVKTSAEVNVYNCIAVWLLFGCVIHMWFKVVICIYVYVCLNV